MKRAVMTISGGCAVALVLLSALFAGCGDSDDVTIISNRTEALCQAETCDCVFTSECPGAMVCVNGACTLDDPTEVDTQVDTDSTTDSDIGGDSVETDSTDAETDSVSPDTTVLVPGALGEFCATNGGCDSGWCLDAPSGGYCSEQCDAGCPDGWICKTVNNLTDPVQLCVQDENRLCQACSDDNQCGGTGDNRCLSIGGGQFCGRACTEDPCPAGYACQILTINGGEVTTQCVPENGTCDCTPESTGLVKSCSATNDAGTCLGNATCEPAQGFIDCTAPEPRAELCDGADNDCDGQTDESFESGACVIENSFGSCDGAQTCQGPSGLVCSAATPTAEACNGLDDDCDGDVDEDFINEIGVFDTVEHCGACGQACEDKFENTSAVACDTSEAEPRCVIVACAPGFIQFNESTCISENATLCTPCVNDSDCFGDASRCLQLSATDPRTFCGRDCSGGSGFSTTCPNSYTCEPTDGASQCVPVTESCDCTSANDGQVKACTRTNAIGRCFGQETCDPARGWVGCNAPQPEEEVCDGMDNDCDGRIDEDIALVGTGCLETNAFGTCSGITVCSAEAGISCTALIPSAEICDGVDNNCTDGVDEGFATTVGGALKYGLSGEHCGACNYACPQVANGTVQCDVSGAVPVCAVGDCNAGFFDFMGIACLPVPTTNSCASCVSDADCQGPNDVCVDDGDGQRFCARDCDVNSIYATAQADCTGVLGETGCCPVNTECTAVGADRVCRPTSGTCRCIVNGTVEACSVANGFGTCNGTRTCDVGAGLGACTAAVPSREICDGQDNDCDGDVDSGDITLDFGTTPDGVAACSNGVGCLGNWACVGTSWECGADAATAEICDGRDNDCDGVDDNGFVDGSGVYVDVNNCGGCGLDCEQLVANSDSVACEVRAGAPTCVATACETGFFPFADATVCLALPDNLCQSCTTDGDCLVPSSRCVDTGAERFCGRSCGASSPYGAACPMGYACEASGQCEPVSGTCQCGPTQVGVARSCPAGLCTGQQACQSLGGGSYEFSTCSAEGFIPEVCDGGDNDCDGQTDEGFLSGGVYATDKNCGQCGNDCLLRWNPATQHAIGACGAGESCVIASCTTETVGATTFEYVNTNLLPADGCECRRVQGNTGQDPPDEVFGGYPAASQTYVDENCDGVDGVATDAMFVSSGAAAGGDGSRATPYQTVGEAIAAFGASGKDYILVAGGNYSESVILVDGIEMHGGYAPDFSSRNIVTFETRINGQQPAFGQASVVPGALNATGVTAATVVSGFVIQGYDVTAVPSSGQGYSSYGLYALDSGDALRVINSQISGGRGGEGGLGSTGSKGFGRTSSGGGALDGGDGVDVDAGAFVCAAGACPAGAIRAGGSAGLNAQCGGANGIGGGDANCPTYNEASWVPPIAGKDGAPGYAWTRDALGRDFDCGSHLTEAGFPEPILKLDGFAGVAGGDGSGGLQGTGCQTTSGQFVGGEWTNSPGVAGADGVFGARGGAGAPSGGVDTASAGEMPTGVDERTDQRYKLGASGGGAGAGGCGGLGGTGGGSGGASIAVFVGYSSPAGLSGAPEVRDNLVARGSGGQGGIGGFGGSGGTGGNGGLGGNSQDFWVGFRAGDGGRGGFGGEGGGGGGGCGGASLGIAAYGYPAGWAPDFGTNVFAAGGDGGDGGQGGPSGQANPAGTGATGAESNVQTVPL